MPTVILVRHGQASFGAEDYDVLSPLGVRQAEVLAAALRRRGVAPGRLVSGTLRRQAETAAPFGDPAELTTDPRWDEYDANQVLAHHAETTVRLDGPDRDGGEQIDSRHFQALLEPALRGWVAAAEESPGAQTWPQFAAAGRAALAELGEQLERGETALVFTSGGTIATLCAALLGAPEAAFPALSRVLVNSSATKIAIGAGGTSLLSFNDHSHLEEADRSLITYR